MFWKKKDKNILKQIPEEYIRLAKKSNMPYVGVGYCERCGHFRLNVSGFEGPLTLPCPRCYEEGLNEIIRFKYTRV